MIFNISRLKIITLRVNYRLFTGQAYVLLDMSVTRTVRGKRPKIYPNDGMDHLMSMTMALVQEVAVLRDRIDLVERVAAGKGIIISDEIEKFELDQTALETREAWRNEYMSRIFAIFEQEAAELQSKDTTEKYNKTLEDIAVS